MLLVETYLNYSDGKGIGLFAKQDIKIGEEVWSRNETFDRVFPPIELSNFSVLTVEYIKKYGFLEKTGNWYLCGDNSRFTNHSNTPNITHLFDNSGITYSAIALTGIKRNEEILCCYSDICETCKDRVVFI